MAKIILFIPDYNGNIGSGHLSRCLTLAKNFINCNVYFFIDPSGTEVVLNAGFKIAENFNINQDLTVIDNYFLDETFHKQIKSGKILVIDDLFNRKLKADYLLYQNYSNINLLEAYKNLIQNNTKCFFGIEYFLLQQSIIRAKNQTGERSYVLVFLTGGSDKNLTLQILKELKGKEIKCVIGSLNSQKQEIINYCKNEKIELFVNTPEMGNLIRNSKFCIGAFGVNSFERLFLERTVIGFQLAENQKDIAEVLNEKGYALKINNVSELKQAFDTMEKRYLEIEEKIKKEISFKVGIKVKNMIKTILSEI